METYKSTNHFARLPYELRYQIYDLVMGRRKTHRWHECRDSIDWHVRRCNLQEPGVPVRWSDGLTPSSNFRTPAPLRVCRQMRDEGFRLFLRDNLFSVECSELGISHFRAWLNSYGAYAKHIRYLSLKFGISHDSVYRTFFAGADPLDHVWESPYVLYVTSYINERPVTAVDRYRGPRMDLAFKYPGSNDDKLEVSRNLTMTDEAELKTVLQPFLRSLDTDGTWNHDSGIMDAIKLFVKHSLAFGNDKRLFVELCQQWLWLGIEEPIMEWQDDS